MSGDEVYRIRRQAGYHRYPRLALSGEEHQVYDNRAAFESALIQQLLEQVALRDDFDDTMTAVRTYVTSNPTHDERDASRGWLRRSKKADYIWQKVTVTLLVAEQFIDGQWRELDVQLEVPRLTIRGVISGQVTTP